MLGVFTAEQQEVVVKAILRYGYPKQLVVAIEELSELQKEICKEIRSDKNGENRYRIIQELADVVVIIEMLALMYNINMEQITPIVVHKIHRLSERMMGHAKV